LGFNARSSGKVSPQWETLPELRADFPKAGTVSFGKIRRLLGGELQNRSDEQKIIQ